MEWPTYRLDINRFNMIKEILFRSRTFSNILSLKGDLSQGARLIMIY